MHCVHHQQEKTVVCIGKLLSPSPIKKNHLGRVVQKPVDVNPGLKVNRRINASCIKMFFTCKELKLLKLQTEGKAI